MRISQWNVTGWNEEPDQTMADGTRRLLVWMQRVHKSDREDAEQLAEQIAIGLRELVGGQTVAVFSREMTGDALRLLAVSQSEAQLDLYEGLESENAAAEGELFEASLFGDSRLAAAHLWANLPAEPFFIKQVPAHLQVIIGEVCDWANTLALTDEARNTLAGDAEAPSPDETAAALPALALPLLSQYGEDENLIVGLALLWIATPEGLLSSHLKPLVEAAAAQAGDALGAARRLERLAHAYRAIAELLASTAERREPNRTGHAKAVAFYAGLIARQLHLPSEGRERVEFAALLHETGKLGVPDAILQKEGKLSPEELENVRVAISSGADWLAETEGLAEIAPLVRHQSERYDGKGTPDGLSGDMIPLGARILAVASRFAAMTQPRADRGPMSVVGGALDSLAEEAGQALDPLVVQAFLEAMGRTL